METLPLYVPMLFIATTILTLAQFYKAAAFSKPVIILTLSWLAIQAALGISGFYLNESTTPPRFGLVLLPPMVFIATRFFTTSGIRFIDGLDIKTLTRLHIIRIPVELTLYWLFLHKAVPQVMTFEGRNFDILCGITAPMVYYFGFVKPVLNKKVLLAWNIVCLLVLANIVVTAVFSTPLQFQQFGFEQPNIALFYFPYVWLPGLLVPVVLFSHLVAIRRLMAKRTIAQNQN